MYLKFYKYSQLLQYLNRNFNLKDKQYILNKLNLLFKLLKKISFHWHFFKNITFTS
jgi:hypothetical protein